MKSRKISKKILILLFFISTNLIYSKASQTFEKSSGKIESIKLSQLYKKLQSLPNAKIKKLTPDSSSKEIYEILLPQPLDHKNPDNGKFNQKITFSHLSFDRPTVLITEGYSMRMNYVKELNQILEANQLRIEHRYFGDSKPDSMDWKYLNIKQAADDLHRIVTLFKQFYKSKWISTGWSKGGQTAVFFRYFYPNDVDVTVAYDAPLNFAMEDKRINEFFATVGTEYCRDKLIAFQRRILENKNQVLPLFKWYTKGRGYSYSIGIEKAFEYIVLEYPFSFWQYHKINCDSIPGEIASLDQILEHLDEVVSFWSYSDFAMNSPSMYQFFSELGYYGYVQKNVRKMLSSTSYPNSVYAPQNANISFNPLTMQKVNNWLQNFGNNMLYIYAELDPWSATAVEISDQTNAVKKILKGGNHYTFIKDFPDEEKEMIFQTLENWLNMEIDRNILDKDLEH